MSYTNRQYVYSNQISRLSNNQLNKTKLILFDDCNKDKIDTIIQKGKLLDIEFIHDSSLSCIKTLNKRIENENEKLKCVNLVLEEMINNLFNQTNKTANYNSNLNELIFNTKLISLDIKDMLANRLAILPKALHVDVNFINQDINVNLNNDFVSCTDNNYKVAVIDFVNLVIKQYCHICNIQNNIQIYENKLLESKLDNADVTYENINYGVNELMKKITNCFLLNFMYLIIFLDPENTVSSLDLNKVFLADSFFSLINDINKNKKIDYKLYRQFYKTINDINNKKISPFISMQENKLYINYEPLVKVINCL